VAAHLTAASRGGPRYDPALTTQQRKSVQNGIWLCGLCAKKIDDDPSRYTGAILSFWRMDAEQLADQDKGRPLTVAGTLRFAAISLDPTCMWRRSHRLAKVALRIGATPELSFHAFAQEAWTAAGVSPETHCCDPILDATLFNDSPTLSILSSIGFVADSVWSDLKGLSRPYKVNVTNGYVMKCDAISVGVPQLLDLPDPVAIPAGVPVRIKLTLAQFRPSLRGNESLLRLLAFADGNLLRSRLINMGVY
jgi:hypothetical protein